MRRFDSAGRDVTNLPGQWDGGDRLMFTPDTLTAELGESVPLADLLEAAYLAIVRLDAKGQLSICRNAVIDDINRLRIAVGVQLP